VTDPGSAPPAQARRHRHLTVAERVARGKAARSQAPRSAHGKWKPGPDRPDPIALLEEQAASRIPELVPVRYGRMLDSPFAFFRGAALIMAADLAATPRSGVNVQLCGDAHLSNFGVFASPERQMLFDINDFDETLPGPWEWDLKRLAASIEVLGRERGFAAADRREMVTSSVCLYRELMIATAKMRELDAWYAHVEIESVLEFVRAEVRQNRLSKLEARRARKDVAKARTRDHLRAFSRLTREVDGELQIVADPPLIVPMRDLVSPDTTREETDEGMRSLVLSYRESLADAHHPIEEYDLVDTARKVVGVGSVGTHAWIHLLMGRDNEDPLFLQSKEAQPSVLERFVGRSVYSHNGHRVVVGQNLMQAATDIFLGWIRVEGLDGQTRDYYVRQLHDWKGSAEVDRLLVRGATLYSRLCAATLARAHARWGDRIAMASYLGKGDAFDCAIADFASAYADQNDRDYEVFVEAVRSGRLAAETGL
jgi:uncharacterized protein (DUF2252 family)